MNNCIRRAVTIAGAVGSMAQGVLPSRAMGQRRSLAPVPVWQAPSAVGAAESDRVQRAASGKLWMYNGVRQRLEFVDESGKILSTAAQLGSTPGEVLTVTWFGIGVNDSLYVWDGTRQRLSVFAPNGAFFRSEPLHIAESDSITVFGRLRDGRWLVAWNRSRRARLDWSGVQRDTIAVSVIRAESGGYATVAALPGRAILQIPVVQDQWRAIESPSPEPVGLSACERGFITWTSSDRVVRAHSADGTLLRAIRLRAPRGSMRRSERPAFLDAYVRLFTFPDIAPSDLRRQLDRRVPKPIPDVILFHIGNDGRVWVYPHLKQMSWSLMNARGRLDTSIDYPLSFRPTSSDHESAIGSRWEDRGPLLQRYMLPPALRRSANADNFLHASLGRCGPGITQ